MNEVDGRDLQSAIADEVFQEFRHISARAIARDDEIERLVMNRVWEGLSKQTSHILPMHLGNRPVLPFNWEGQSHPALYLCYHTSAPLIVDSWFEPCLNELINLLYAATGIRHIVATSDHYGAHAYVLKTDSEPFSIQSWELRKREC